MILLVACGNVLRRDDGAGIMLARRLRKCRRADLQIVECQQLTPELAPRLADPAVTAIFFVDAAVVTATSAPATRVHYLPESAEFSLFGHHFGPAALLALASRLYGRQPPAWLVSLPAADFRFGVGLSRRTRQELRRAEVEVLALLASVRPVNAACHTS